MTPARCIGFDADDTLWHNENIFERVHVRYCEVLARHHDADTVRRALDATERRNFDLYGYGIKGFMLCAIETAIELTAGKLSSNELREILALGHGMLEHPVELLEGAAEVLETLARSHSLLLVTKGDLVDQQRKLVKSGLASRFQAIEIVAEKDQHTYERILQRHDIEPKNFLMVGNSIKSDIAPVLALGGSAVHIPYQYTWGREHADVPQGCEGRFFQVASIGELPAIVERWR